MIEVIWKSEEIETLINDLTRGLHPEDIFDRYEKNKTEILEKIYDLYTKGVLDFKIGSLEQARRVGFYSRNENGERMKFRDLFDGVGISENRWGEEEE